MEYVFLLLFSLWVGLTILWQFKKVREEWRFLQYVNVFNWLPVWTFFSPNPGMTDVHLVFRDKDDEGQISDWQEAEFMQVRKPVHTFWNPNKRLIKLMVDATSEVKIIQMGLKEHSAAEIMDNPQITFSKGYLILLHFAFSFPGIYEGSKSRQFALVYSSNMEKTRTITPIFISGYHELTA